MIFEKIRNYEAAMGKHSSSPSSAPTDLELEHLPVDRTPREQTSPPGETTVVAGNEASGADSDADSVDMEEGRDPVRAAACPEPIAHLCGTLPRNRTLEEFCMPPVRVHGRNAEGRYWKEFAEQTRSVMEDTALTDSVSLAMDDSWNIAAGDAAAAAGHQKRFFRCVDNFQIEVDEASLVVPTAHTFDKLLTEGIGALPQD